MSNRFLKVAPKIFLLAHAGVWSLVVTVWATTWDPYWENSGPVFNNARRCLGQVDALIDAVAERLAITIALSLNGMDGRNAAFFVIALAAATLVLGSVQWLALGKAAQAIGRYNEVGGACLVTGLVGWILLPLIHWACLTFA